MRAWTVDADDIRVPEDFDEALLHRTPEIWSFAQLGLVEVAYQLRRINHHIKVFAAVRKEAYARLQTTVMGQQYRGSAVDIVYPVESLREIFINNVRLEKSDRMVLPERLRAHPIEAFLG